MSESTSRRIYSQLRKRIFTGEYPPDKVLSEPQIAVEFGTSRTPAREAMSQLVNDGFLLRFPSCGYVVRRVDAAEMAEQQQFRRTIERGIFESIITRSPDASLRSLREAIKREEFSQADARNSNFHFHMKLAELSGNRFYVEALEKALNSAARAFATPSTLVNEDEATLLQEIQQGHIRIIDALLAHDLDEALLALDRDYKRNIRPFTGQSELYTVGRD